MPDAATQIRFGLLGPVTVDLGGTEVGVPASRQRILLAALLLRANHTVETAELADLVWNGKPPTAATTTLRSYMMRLRRTLGPVAGARLRTQVPGYRVELLDAAELDLLRFDELRRSGLGAAARQDWTGAAGDLRAALGLWRGAALEDVPAGVLKDREIPSLQEGLIQAHELLARSELELGHPGEALARVLRLQAEHPYREQLSCLLMRAQCAAGRPTEALDEFARLRRSLVDELGVEPGAHSRALQSAILAGAPLPPWPLDGSQPSAARPAEQTAAAAAASAPANDGSADSGPGPAGPTVPAQLPSGLQDFTGRADQVDHLCGALTGGLPPNATGGVGTASLCLVSGAGGVGKTTLAVQVAHHVAAGFPDGQLFLDLRGSGRRPVAPADALSSFLRALGVADAAIPRDEQEREALYRSHLATRRVLLLLDDVRDAAQLRPLLPGSAGCGVLATSRSRCASLSVSARTELGALARQEAEDLFAAIVGAERALREPAAVALILDCCGLHPLAVRIAAARLVARPDWSAATLAALLAERRSRLGELVVDDLGVRVSFGLSYDTLAGADCELDREAARVFRLLGLWQGGEVGLAAVAALADRTVEATRQALDRLADIHFVREPQAGRFAVHDLLHLYARELVEAGAESDGRPGGESGQDRTAAVERLGTWYLHSAYQAMEQFKPERRRFDLSEVPEPDTALRFDSYAGALAWLDQEQANLRAVTLQVDEARLEPLAQLLPMETLHHLLLRRELDLVLETQLISLESARRTGRLEHQASSYNSLAHAYMELKQIDEGLSAAHAALEIHTRLDDRHGMAAATESIAMTYYFGDRHEEALPWFERALPLRREAGHPYGLLATLNNLGLLQLELGRAEEAVVAFQESIPMAREAGSLIGIGAGQLNLGEAYLALGRLPEAMESLREAIATGDECDDPQMRGNSLSLLGDALTATGEHREAVLAWQQAAECYDRLGEPQTAAELRRRVAEADPGGSDPGPDGPGHNGGGPTG
ncbi:AfsR/SARP family transcriptional regulator [Streptacidiphilus carbonis]|uniref:AfsR/SARP family transcriptional regulator n=1 Tax=Streptacidiphilus carbonis TaxID=105422 RepID=UPI00126A593E|nr:BTAD domain-containing putative transcriptional regulator [Streptacidiphilus carbonis]